MNKKDIDIDIVKQFVDNDTLVKMATLQAEKKAKEFKYLLNVIKDKKYHDKLYGQLKGTIGYDGKTKLWVNQYIGRINKDTVVDKSAICLKYSSIMRNKAKDAILKELLK
jgi:hypothetical protein